MELSSLRQQLKAIIEILVALHARRSSCVYLVSRTPSLILHLQAELKSGAETQRRSSPDSCTSSSWATWWPCRVSRVKTLSEIWKCPQKIQIRQKLHWQTDGPAGCDLREGDAAALTWSLIPVAMWPTFTRRVSLMRILRQLKSLMQTSTPGANHRAEIHAV